MPPSVRPTGLSAWLQGLITLAGLGLGLLVFGFVLFAAVVMRESVPSDAKADGIIVLTGGDYRITEGARLLSEGRAQRLLISGVNEKTTRDDLIKMTGLDPGKFSCCVDLGYAAQDTIGNAEEAKTWAGERRIGRLIVVTSSYHMPRSLAQLAMALPGVTLIPHAVVPMVFRDGAWWLRPIAARILLSEYMKFLPVAARLTAMRYLGAKIPTVASDSPPVPSHS